MKNFIIIFLFIMSFASSALESVLNIKSKALGEQIEVKIYKPSSYNEVNQTKYPVIYVLDGPQHASHTVANAAFLNSTDVMPEIIVVAISNVNRYKFFTPTLVEHNGRESGKADLYVQFLKSELMPQINNSYRVSGFNMIAGHSLGGLLAAYILQSEPNLFDAYYMFSPSMWWDNETLISQMDAKPNIKMPFVYVSIANEQGKQRAAYEHYKNKLSVAYPLAIYQEFPNEDHMTTPLISQISAFRAQFSHWLLAFDDVVKNPQVFISHYQKLNNQYGTNVQGKEWEIGQPTQHIINELKDIDKALVASDVHFKMFPQSQWAYKSKADALALKGDMSSAISYMKKAVKIAEEQNDQYLGLLQSALKTLTDKSNE